MVLKRYWLAKLRQVYVIVLFLFSQVSNSFECSVLEPDEQTIAIRSLAKSARSSSSGLVTLRLAVAVTREASTSLGYSDDASLQTFVNNILNIINPIFERDLAVRFVLATNNNNLLFHSGESDGFPSESSTGSSWGSTQLTDAQQRIYTIIGESSHDLGITIISEANGIAALSGVGVSSSKSRAAAGIRSYVSDGMETGQTGLNNFAISMFSHELGHLLGASHIHSGLLNSTTDCNVNTSTSVQPGSGSTIMSYAGNCFTSIQEHADDYFGYISIEDILESTSGVGTTSSFSQSINPISLSSTVYNIPPSTPFLLNATHSGVSSPTYNWEQADPAVYARFKPVTTQTTGPIFRSYPSVSQTYRYFPRADSLKAEVNPMFEVLPSVARTLNFNVTAKDQVGGGEQTAMHQVTVNIVGSIPFQITTQTSNEIWNHGQLAFIQWDASSTKDGTTIDCGKVNIYLVDVNTNDSDYTKITLASNVSNHGSRAVYVDPTITTGTYKVMVQSVGNIFYALSQGSISVQNNTTDDLAYIYPRSLVIDGCKSGTSQIHMDYASINSYSGSFSFSFSSNDLPEEKMSFNPVSTLSLSSGGNYGSIILEFTPDRPILDGEYALTISRSTTSAATGDSSYDLTLDVDNDHCGYVEQHDLKRSEFMSPDGDGINDIWNIERIEDFPNNCVRIFNSQRVLLYEKQSYKNDYDFGNLPEGSYMYQVDLYCNRKEIKRGWFYLKR